MSDIRKILDRFDMAHIGTWTICNTIKYSLYPSLVANCPPKPSRLLLLADEANLLTNVGRLVGTCGNFSLTDTLEPSVVREYLQHIPFDNILWFDEVDKIRGDHWKAEEDSGGSAPKARLSNVRSTQIARIQLDWLKIHRDGTHAFDRYLSRLEQVVHWYESHPEQGGPAWGSHPGYQWEPLRTWTGFPDISFLEKHPQQTSKAALLFEGD